MGFKFLIFISTFILVYGQNSRADDLFYETPYVEIRNEVLAKANEIFNQIYKKDCFTKGGFVKTPTGYGCGEYPIGKIQGKGNKEIGSVSFKYGEVMDSGTFNFPVVGSSPYAFAWHSNEKFQLIMKRIQHASIESMPIVGYGSNSNVRIKKELNRNLFIKMQPKGDHLLSEVCHYSPGVKVLIPDNKISIYFEIYAPGPFDPKYGITTTVDGGEVLIKNIKTCAVLETRLEGNDPMNLIPITKVIQIKDPVVKKDDFEKLILKNTVVTPLRWHTKILDVVAGFFGVNIPGAIKKAFVAGFQKQINNEVSLAVNDFEDGTALQKILEEKLKELNISRAITGVRGKINNSHNVKRVFKQDMEGQCYDAFDDMEDELGLKLKDSAVNRTCRDLSVSVFVTPFQGRAIYRNRHCYNSFMPVYLNIVKRKGVEVASNRWKNCSLSAKVEIEGPHNLSATRKCMFDAFMKGLSNKQVVNQCKRQAILDMTSIKTMNNLKSVINSNTPVKQLQNLGFTKSNAQRIAAILGLI